MKCGVIGNILGNTWELEEHIENIMGTHQECGGNTKIRQKKTLLALNPTNALFWFSLVKWAQETR